MAIERGQIYRVNLEPTVRGEQRGVARPCVILTATGLNRRRSTVGVLPLSTSPRRLPPLVVAVPSAGSPDSVALCDQLRTVDKRRLIKLAGELSKADLKAVAAAIKEVYELF